MTNLCYIPKTFNAEHLRIIETANKILDQYKRDGFRITLRGLYYQFVGKALIENSDASYNRLGGIISDARLAGLVSWHAIEDNLRVLQGLPTQTSPGAALRKMRADYRIDLWANQPWQPEVWVEKDAMVGVMEGICNELRVNMLACRGYMSQTAMWEAGQRMAGYIRDGKRPIIFHFGDHDPSGLDMTRDNHERVEMFAGARVTMARLSLNRAQVERYRLPPNPLKLKDGKLSDSRAKAYAAKAYVREHGRESWELDAMPPRVIADLIAENVAKVRDEKLWAEACAVEADDLDTLDRVIESVEE